MSFFHDKDRDLPFGFDGDLLTVGLTRKFIPPPWEEGGGGGWMEPLPGVFNMLQYFAMILPFKWKAFDVFYKMRGIFYGWWRCWRPVTLATMVAILDFTKN